MTEPRAFHPLKPDQDIFMSDPQRPGFLGRFKHYRTIQPYPDILIVADGKARSA